MLIHTQDGLHHKEHYTNLIHPHFLLTVQYACSPLYNYLINFIKEVEWCRITFLDGKDQPQGN
jgi:hypothetical protein